jgi:chemotaxis protein methyltransferase CheR
MSMAIDEFERSNMGQLKMGADRCHRPVRHHAHQLQDRRVRQPGDWSRLSQERLQRYFDPKGPGRWAIKAPIKNRVEFRSFNLLDSYAAWASSTSCSAATC